MLRLKFIIIFLFFIFYACVTIYNPATDRYEYILIDSNTEVAIGRSAQNELLKKKKLYQDPIINERLRNIAKALVAVSDRKDIQYHFYVLDDRELNAMALPGGFIYINKGLVDLLDDDELAYVISHEIAHIAARHIVKKMQATMTYELIMGIALIGVGANLGDTNNQGIIKGIDMIFDFVSLGYSRKDEYEADRLAVKYTYRAGFNPYAAISTLERIKKEEGPNWKILGYFRSHPYAEERIAVLKNYIPKLISHPK